MSSGSASHRGEEGPYDPGARGAGSLPASWARHWTEAPSRPFLLGEGKPRSYGDLERLSRGLADALRGEGLQPGDRVLVSSASSPRLVELCVACLRAGLALVPLGTACRRPEVAHVVRDAQPRAAWVDSPEHAAWLAELDPGIARFGPDREPGPGPATELDSVAPGALALVAYTSGTTGRPKGAALSHANLLASVEALRLAWGWTRDDRLALVLPLFHMHGLGVGLFGTLHAGAALWLRAGFEAGPVLEAVEQHGLTLFFGVPTIYHRLAAEPDAGVLARLRLCVSGSAPLPAELHRRFESRAGQRILERYGMTETAMLVSNPLRGERRPGSVGLPLPGVELRLVGEPAEVQVRGPSVFSGYWRQPEANARAFTADGWFRTGDLGELDEAGYLHLTGRASELVISGGQNVYPREVEDALREHPEIADAAVLGTPSEEWGERVTAYVVASRELPLDELRAFLADRLAAYKHPRRLHHLAELPRNALGKVQKHRLRDGRVLPEADGDPA